MSVFLAVLFSATLPVQVAPADIHAQVDRFVETVNSHDTTALVRLYGDHEAVSSLGDGTITVGPVAVTFLLAAFIGPGVRMTADSVVVQPLGNDAAVAAMRYQLDYPGRSSVWGAMTLVFVRTPAGWRIAHDHMSSLPGRPRRDDRMGTTVSSGGPPAPVRATHPCDLTRVVDGDTIQCRTLGRVRLIGMDTPESSQEPHGSMATAALATFLARGNAVSVENDAEARDRYDRALGYVWVDDVMANWWLVRNGWAVVLTYPPNVQYVEWLTRAQGQARSEALGLWAMGGFDCLPRDRRARRC